MKDNEPLFRQVKRGMGKGPVTRGRKKEFRSILLDGATNEDFVQLPGPGIHLELVGLWNDLTRIVLFSLC